MHTVAGCVVLAGLGACASVPDRSEAAFAECRSLLEEQAEAWNRGDLEAFCEGYRRSENTVFASAAGAQVGWQAMHDRYRARYPDRAAMGRLRFSELAFDRLGRDSVAVRGRWQLTRAGDAPSGRFLLVFRRFDEGFRIVLDYTTSEVAAAGGNVRASTLWGWRAGDGR